MDNLQCATLPQVLHGARVFQTVGFINKVSNSCNFFYAYAFFVHLFNNFCCVFLQFYKLFSSITCGNGKQGLNLCGGVDDFHKFPCSHLKPLSQCVFPAWRGKNNAPLMLIPWLRELYLSVIAKAKEYKKVTVVNYFIIKSNSPSNSYIGQDLRNCDTLKVIGRQVKHYNKLSSLILFIKKL